MMRSSSLAVFACMSKVCAPPPVGRGGSMRSNYSGAALMWRFDDQSPHITSAAAELLGVSGWGGNNSSEHSGHARQLLDAIDAAPISTRRLYSGHTLGERLDVGDEVEYPLMATSYRMGTAQGYSSSSIRRTSRPTPLSPELVKEWHSLRPELRDSWGPSNVPQGHVVGGDRHTPVRAVFRLMSSKSVPVSDWERVTSGRFKVVARRTETIKDAWVYDFDIHDYRELTRDVYDIEYVGQAGGS